MRDNKKYIKVIDGFFTLSYPAHLWESMSKKDRQEVINRQTALHDAMRASVRKKGRGNGR